MNATDHFREAVRLLGQAADKDLSGNVYYDRESAHDVAAAQVHATLALAAASGADKPPPNAINVRTMADPGGDYIVDQMGDVPTSSEDESAEPCGYTDTGQFCHNVIGHDGPHFDDEGRDFT